MNGRGNAMDPLASGLTQKEAFRIEVSGKAVGLLIGHMTNEGIDRIGGYLGLLGFASAVVDQCAATDDQKVAEERACSVLGARLPDATIAAMGGPDAMRVHVRQVASVYATSRAEGDIAAEIEAALEPILDFGASIPEDLIDEDRAPVDRLTAGDFRRLVRLWSRMSAFLAARR
jgi:hypothetical protein